jgi:hypothetical protein
MTQEQKTRIEEHHDRLYHIATVDNIPDDIRDALKAAYLAGAAYALDIYCPQWISVEDELPPTSDKDDESDDYLIVDSDGDKNVGYYNKMDKLWFSCDGYILDATHWMPIPQAPKKGGKE